MLLQKKTDATSGPIFSNLIRFAIPIAISSLIQSLFNAIDLVVIGFFDTDGLALASVGATSVIASLIVQIALGLGGGIQTIIANAVGARDKAKVKRTTDTAMIFGLILGIIMVFIGLFGSRTFLKLTDCPASCLDGATLYLQIYIASSPAIMIYTYGAGVLRGNGDSKRPFYYIISAGFMNFFANIILCLILENKIAAVAIATLASQVLGATLVTYRLLTTSDECKVVLKEMRFSFTALKSLLFLGVPCAINNALFQICNLQIQSAINSHGPAAISGNTASISIENCMGAFTGAVQVALLTFIGQNLGAKNRKRVKQTILYGCILNILLGLILGVGVYSLGRPLLTAYLHGNSDAVKYGLLRMQYIVLPYAICAFKAIFASTLHAFNYVFLTTANFIFSTLIFRIFWMNVVYPKFGTMDNIYLCYLVSWFIELAISVIIFIFAYKKKMNKKNFPDENEFTEQQQREPELA